LRRFIRRSGGCLYSFPGYTEGVDLNLQVLASREYALFFDLHGRVLAPKIGEPVDCTATHLILVGVAAMTRFNLCAALAA
jgi:hypothetical protein